MLPPTPETRFVKNLVTMKARVQLVVVAMEEALDFTCSTVQYSTVQYSTVQYNTVCPRARIPAVCSAVQHLGICIGHDHMTQTHDMI